MSGIVVPRVDSNEQLTELGIDALDSTFGQYTGALWDEPTLVGDIGRFIDRTSERRKLRPTIHAPSGAPARFVRGLLGFRDEFPNPSYDPSGRMSDTDANEQFGIPGELTFKGPVPRAVAQDLWEGKRAELARNDIYGRFKGGAAQQVAGFGVGLISQALDPLNAASAFLPVVGEARFALWAERFGSVAARVGVGAIEGAAGAALLEPLTYSFAQDEQRNYGWVDSVANITFGTIIGAGLHAGVGAVSDRIAAWRNPGGALGGSSGDVAAALPPAVRRAAEASPEVNEAALRGSVAALVEDRPVQVSRLYDAAENPPARVGDPDVIRVGEAARAEGKNWEVVQVFGRNGPVLVRDADAAAQGREFLRAFSSPREFARATGVRIARDDLTASAQAMANAPESLSEYVRRTGGISLEDARNYGLLAEGESPVGKLAGIVRRDGRSLDRVREDVAQEAVGYIKPDADLNDLAEAISRDLRGRSTEERVFSINDADAVQTRAEYERQFAEASRLAELSPDEMDGVRADARQALDDAERGYDPVFEAGEELLMPAGDPFDLETSAVLAADIKSRTKADDRFAEARAALDAAEHDLALMRNSGDVPEEEIAALEREVAAERAQADDMIRAYDAGANCLARSAV